MGEYKISNEELLRDIRGLGIWKAYEPSIFPNTINMENTVVRQ